MSALLRRNLRAIISLSRASPFRQVYLCPSVSFASIVSSDRFEVAVAIQPRRLAFHATALRPAHCGWPRSFAHPHPAGPGTPGQTRQLAAADRDFSDGGGIAGVHRKLRAPCRRRFRPRDTNRDHRRGGTLFAQRAAQAAFPVFKDRTDHFVYDVVEAALTFERDTKGKVTALVLHQNGRDIRAPRPRRRRGDDPPRPAPVLTGSLSLSL